jgi:hypothetical protein
MNMIGNTLKVRYRTPNIRAHLAASLGIMQQEINKKRYQRSIRKSIRSERSSAACSIACALEE